MQHRAEDYAEHENQHGHVVLRTELLGATLGALRAGLRSLDVFRREAFSSDGVRRVVLVRVLHASPERDASFLGGSRPSNSVVLGEGRSGDDSTLGSVSSVGCDDSSVECGECERFGHNELRKLRLLRARLLTNNGHAREARGIQNFENFELSTED